MQAQQRAAEMRAARLQAERAALEQHEQEQAVLIDTSRQERLRRLAVNQAATAQHLQVRRAIKSNCCCISKAEESLAC